MKISSYCLKNPLRVEYSSPYLLAGFDREGHEVLLLKPETDHDVGDRIPHPVDRDQVDRVQLFEIERFVIIPHVEVRFGAVGQVADVVDGDEITFNVGKRQHGHVALPRPVVRGWDGHPPARNGRKYQQKPDQGPEPVAQAKKGQHRGQTEDRGRNRAQQAGGRVRPVDRKRSPGGHEDDDYRADEHPGVLQKTQHHLPPQSLRFSTRMRRTSSMASGDSCAEWPEWTTSSEATPSMWALL